MRRLELRCGATRRLLDFQQLLAAVAAANLVFVSTTPAWMALSMLSLLAVHLGSLWYMARWQQPATLLVREDDTLRVGQGAGRRYGALTNAAWVSRWICVFRWKPVDSRADRACLVCSWVNPPEEYRRLMVRLRLPRES